MESVKSLFEDKLTSDDREPIGEFYFNGDKFDLLAPRGEFWKQVLAVRIEVFWNEIPLLVIHARPFVQLSGS